jgi:hypothetical protein
VDFWFFFSLSLECLDYGLQLVGERKKSLVNYALLSFLLKNNGCNIVDGVWMVVKLLVTNKRYFFQENSHHVLQMLLFCVHAWSISLFCLLTMATQGFIPFSFYFVVPFTSLLFCFYVFSLMSPSFYLFYNCQSLFSSND